MATQIATSTYADATGPSASPLVVFAPSDNSAIVLWHNGTAPKLSTAQSPYTTWSTQTVGSATTRHFGGLRVNSDDSVDVVICSPSNGAFWFGFTRSGNSWSSGSNGAVGVGNTFTTGNADAAQIHKDPQGRLWWVQIDPATPTLVAAYTSAPATSWTSSLSQTTLQNHRGAVFSAIIGNYLVVVYGTASGHLSYQRVDVSGASVGSWSSAAAISGITDEASTIQGDLVSFDTSKGMLVYSSANGIKAYTYDSSTDTWASSATLSASSSDLQPSLVAGASGTVYAIWAQNSSGSNYALVSKAYSGGSWDSSATSLETTAAGQSYPHAAYISSSDKFGLLFTNATASPFGVEFDLVSAPTTGGGSALTGAATLGGTTGGVSASGTLAASGAATLGSTTGGISASAALGATGSATAGDLTGGIDATGALGATGAATLGGATGGLTAAGALGAVGVATLGSLTGGIVANVGGTAKTGAATLGDLTGGIDATGQRGQRGAASLGALTGGISADGALAAAGAALLGSLLGGIVPSGALTLAGVATLGDLTGGLIATVATPLVFGRATATATGATTATATATDATTATATVAAASTATATLSTR